ncbi:MAG: peptidase inhibitor family I36 protein [Devosia sp.]
MLRAILATAILAFGFTLPAAAGQPAGSAAWAVTDATVYAGPGVAYDVVGTISEASKLRVDRCSHYFCQVRGDGMKGWIALVEIDFGRGPNGLFNGLFSGPVLNYPPGGADVCFYTGAGYTGTSWCVPPGHVARDAELWGKDDTISSIMLMDGAKLRVCRDRNFHSWCELITESEPNLSGFLDNNISSWQVY